MNVKKAWLTPWTNDARLVSLSLESAGLTPESGRISVREMEFPDRNSKQARHTVNLALLDDSDILALHKLLGEHLAQRGVSVPSDGGGWVKDGSVLYRTKDGSEGRSDVITVDVVNGRTDSRSRSRRAMEILVLLNG